MTDPKRWMDPESRSTAAERELIRAARSDLPDEDRVEGMGTRLASLLTGVQSAATGTTASSSGAVVKGVAGAGLKVATAAKIGAVAVMVLGVGASGYFVRHRPPRAPASSSFAAPVAQRATETASTPMVATSSGLQDSPPLAQPAPVPPARSSSAPGSGATREPAVPGESEVELLQSAQDALASDPARALSIATLDATRFPRGALAQERDVIAIEALVRLGRRDEARLRAARFERAFPRSAHHLRIEELLDEGAPHRP